MSQWSRRGTWFAGVVVLIGALVAWNFWPSTDAPAAAPTKGRGAITREMPVLVHDVAPTLPADLQAPDGGEAAVDLEIGGNGLVSSARIASSSVPAANEAILAAVKAYRFDMPASLNGKGASLSLIVQIPPTVTLSSAPRSR